MIKSITDTKLLLPNGKYEWPVDRYSSTTNYRPYKVRVIPKDGIHLVVGPDDAVIVDNGKCIGSIRCIGPGCFRWEGIKDDGGVESSEADALRRLGFHRFLKNSNVLGRVAS